MKNDINKISEVTFEMKMNDLVFSMVQTRFNELVEDVKGCTFVDAAGTLGRLYFYKRFMSVFANYDIPVKASIGLCMNLDNLYKDKEKYIGDSDTDNDIYRYATEYGYRKFDDIALATEKPEDVFDKFVAESFKHYAERGEKCDE